MLLRADRAVESSKRAPKVGVEPSRLARRVGGGGGGLRTLRGPRASGLSLESGQLPSGLGMGCSSVLRPLGGDAVPGLPPPCVPSPRPGGGASGRRGVTLYPPSMAVWKVRGLGCAASRLRGSACGGVKAKDRRGMGCASVAAGRAGLGGRQQEAAPRPRLERATCVGRPSVVVSARPSVGALLAEADVSTDAQGQILVILCRFRPELQAHLRYTSTRAPRLATPVA